MSTRPFLSNTLTNAPMKVQLLTDHLYLATTCLYPFLSNTLTNAPMKVQFLTDHLYLTTTCLY